jgi:hypothetical protein
MARRNFLGDSAGRNKKSVRQFPNSYYKALLAAVAEISEKRGAIRRACVPPDGSLAKMVGPHIICWWGFYELPLLTTTMFVAKVLGLADALRHANDHANPHRAAIDALTGEIAGELTSLEPLKPSTRALLIGAILSLINSLEAAKYYGLTMDQLVSPSQRSKESALRKAVSIDPLAVATRAGAAILAAKTLKGEEGYCVSLMATRLPAKRRTHRELRILHLLMRDVGALKGTKTDDLVDIVCGTLGRYAKYAGDAGRNLRELFRRFEKDATT